MKKRILAMFLAGMMVFTMTPAEVFATEVPEQEEAQPEDSTEDRIFPVGGLERLKAIEIPEEEIGRAHV